MKLWVIRHKNYAIRHENLSGFSLEEKFSDNTFVLKAVHAFIRKKEALKYISDNYAASADYLTVQEVSCEDWKWVHGKSD